MKLNCEQLNRNIARFLLVVLNGCCIMLAVGTIVFALVDTQILKQYGEDRSVGTFVGDLIIITAALYLVAVACFGTVGAVKGNAKVLYMYVGFLMTLVVMEVFIAVYVALQRFGLQFTVSEWMREDFFMNVTGEEKVKHQKLWDKLQINYECCGLNGPEDYQALMKPLSLSCCPRAYCATTDSAKKQLYKHCIESRSYYKVGCEKEILFVLQSDAEWLVTVAMTSFGFEAAGMLLAIFVANNLKAKLAMYKLPVKF